MEPTAQSFSLFTSLKKRRHHRWTTTSSGDHPQRHIQTLALPLPSFMYHCGSNCLEVRMDGKGLAWLTD
jgi:hypothetical protein